MPGLRHAVSTGYTSGQSVGRGVGGESVAGRTIAPTGRTVGSPAGTNPSGWLDFSQVPAWRALYTVGALGYLGVFHFTLPGGLASVGRTGGGLPHGHGLAVALYIASWLVVIDAGRDVLFHSYPSSPAASALKQAV